VRIAVRVRPFSQTEASAAVAKRIVQRGSEPGSLVVVNPTKFKASADAVAAAVAALTRANMASFDWARVFSVDHTFWSDVSDTSAPLGSTAGRRQLQQQQSQQSALQEHAVVSPTGGGSSGSQADVYRAVVSSISMLCVTMLCIVAESSVFTCNVHVCTT
jgi:hypothetical protein